ncbi:MAG: phosphoribosyltransferase [Desulfobulbaceae bacterium]
MKSDNLISEWSECRNTIGRFDGYLLNLRLLGFSVFTLLFTAISGVAGSKKAMMFFSPDALLFSVIILSLFVLAIYILDRYYERMLLVAVFRSSHLEAHRLEGFRIGLTTEIEFQKEKISNKSINFSFFKASHMVNFVYALMFITMWSEYIALSKLAKCEPIYILIFVFMVSVVSIIALLAHSLLREPGSMIEIRSKVVKSPVVISREEIMHLVDRIVSEITTWLKNYESKEVYIISILFGARPFTDDLILSLKSSNIKVNLFLIQIESTSGTEHLKENFIKYGDIDASSFAGKNVLIVDDLLDSGRTIDMVKSIVNKSIPKSVKVAVLLNKYKDIGTRADFVGLDLGLSKDEMSKKGIQDYWLFGYGMDLDGQYREIEHVGWIEKTE